MCAATASLSSRGCSASSPAKSMHQMHEHLTAQQHTDAACSWLRRLQWRRCAVCPGVLPAHSCHAAVACNRWPILPQGRRRAAEAARLERLIAQRRAAREAAWTAFRVPRIPLHQLLAAALGCAVPPLLDPSALPKRPPSASAFPGQLHGRVATYDFLYCTVCCGRASLQSDSDQQMRRIRPQPSTAHGSFLSQARGLRSPPNG